MNVGNPLRARILLSIMIYVWHTQTNNVFEVQWQSCCLVPWKPSGWSHTRGRAVQGTSRLPPAAGHMFESHPPSQRCFAVWLRTTQFGYADRRCCWTRSCPVGVEFSWKTNYEGALVYSASWGEARGGQLPVSCPKYFRNPATVLSLLYHASGRLGGQVERNQLKCVLSSCKGP